MGQIATESIPSEFEAINKGNMLCLDQYANLGGAQRSLLDLLPEFSRDGWEIHAAIVGAGPLCDVLPTYGFQTYSLRSAPYASIRKPPSQILRYAFDLRQSIQAIGKIVDEQEIDLIYVNGPRVLPPAAWVARKLHIPLVFHCHNRLFQNSAIMLAGEALRLSNAWVAASCSYAAEPIKDYVWPDRLRVVYNGVRQIRSKKHSRLREAWRIAVVGRVEEGKGQLEFIRAAKLVAQKFPKCEFAIIGSPMFSNSRYYKKVQATALGSPVQFTVWQADIAKLYSDIDLLVVPSNHLEATTRVIMEAFSAGIPVIAFPSGGIPEILEDERTGFLAAGTTSEALAQRILTVLRIDRKYLSWIIAQAREEWKNRFTLETYVRNIRSIINKATNESPN